MEIFEVFAIVFVNRHSGAKQLHGSLLYIEVFIYVNKIAFLRASNKKVKEITKIHTHTHKSWKTPHFSNTRDASQRDYAIIGTIFHLLTI